MSGSGATSDFPGMPPTTLPVEYTKLKPTEATCYPRAQDELGAAAGRRPQAPARTPASRPGPATSPPSPARRRPPRPACSRRSQMGMADTIKAFPKKRAEDFAERLRLKSCRSKSSSDCCLEPPLGAMVDRSFEPGGRCWVNATGPASTAAVSTNGSSALRAEAGLGAAREQACPGLARARDVSRCDSASRPDFRVLGQPRG